MPKAYVHRHSGTRQIERHIGAHRTGRKPVAPVKSWRDIEREPLWSRIIRALVRGI